MIVGLLLAAALQAGAVQPSPTMSCSMTNAAGDSIAFGARPEAADGLSIIPFAGSPWPARAILGARAVRVQPESFSRNAFAFGDARHGVILHLASAPEGQDWRVATLYGRDGSYAGLPLAYGFCRPAALVTSSVQGSTAATGGPVDTSSFDPARWREGDCALVTLAGLRTRFRFTVRNQTSVEFAAEEASLWNGAPLAVEHRVVRQLDGRSPGAAMLGAASGLDGLEMMFAQFDPPRAVQLLQFRRLGGAGPAGAEPGFAICGHPILVRGRAD